VRLQECIEALHEGAVLKAELRAMFCDEFRKHQAALPLPPPPSPPAAETAPPSERTPEPGAATAALVVRWLWSLTGRRACRRSGACRVAIGGLCTCSGRAHGSGRPVPRRRQW
jgi:hypothetical protein